MRLSVISVATALFLGVIAKAAHAVPRFDMTLGVRSEDGEVFGVMPDSMGKTRRLYPGERIEAVLTAYLSEAPSAGLTNEMLVRELRACLMSGDQEDALGVNESVPCSTPTGVTWEITPLAESNYTLSATIRSRKFHVPAGTYTLFSAVAARQGRPAVRPLPARSVLPAAA
jgi:hypothetical protein